jgi:hypothetical protein
MQLERPPGECPPADLETKLFVVVLGLSEVLTNSDTDMIDAPPSPDKSPSGRLGIVAFGIGGV